MVAALVGNLPVEASHLCERNERYLVDQRSANRNFVSGPAARTADIEHTFYLSRIGRVGLSFWLLTLTLRSLVRSLCFEDYFSRAVKRALACLYAYSQAGLVPHFSPVIGEASTRVCGGWLFGLVEWREPLDFIFFASMPYQNQLPWPVRSPISAPSNTSKTASTVNDSTAASD